MFNLHEYLTDLPEETKEQEELIDIQTGERAKKNIWSAVL